jgi:hypothetical protein
MAADAATIHASAVLIGPKAALVRGPAGSGKSQFVWALLQLAGSAALPFARLVGDDRLHVETHAGRLLVRPALELAGMIEIRGLGIRRLPYEPVAVAGFVLDLAAPDGERYPTPEAGKASIGGVILPRLAVPIGAPALGLVLAYTGTLPAAN